MSQIFISYAQKDLDFVKRIASDLISVGLKVSYDLLVEPGESWAESLSRSIEEAQYFLVVMSPDYFESAWAQEELQVGMLRETENKALVIPLLLTPCTPAPFLSRKVSADFTSDYSAGLKQLLKALRSRSPNDEDPIVGDTIEHLEPKEFQSLRRELKEAVDLFKSKPASDSEMRKSDTKCCTCFVVMPYGDHDLQVVYEDFVKPVLENEIGTLCERGDDVFGSNVVMEDIITSIKRSDVIIADLTGKNANVFYEVGICHTLGKHVLLMAQTIDDVPFDLRHRRVLLYEYTPRGCKRLEQSLKDNIKAILHKHNE